MSKIDQELHEDTAPETEPKPVKETTPKPATPVTSTERARAIVRAKLAAR
jgi:hypothetical protein